MASPYDVLGIDPDATDATVKAAYRDRVKDVHPDQGGTAREFRRVTAAYRAITSEDWEPRTPADTEERDDQGPAVARVEYLDYDVVVDRDWSLEDPDLFERAARADLTERQHGVIEVPADDPLLAAAEGKGCYWPFACRGGACANCAVAVHDGDLSNPGDNILSDDLHEAGFRLSCIGKPLTDTVRVVVGLQNHPRLADLRLPADRFERARSTD
ncbi:MAG: 2Fe-2S iron-sulfur cluster-binding protein [Halobacteriaceae archaeon]